MAWIRRVVVAVLFAALGAVLGRVVSASRLRAQAGEPFEPSVDDLAVPSVRDLVPGLVAALRVNDRPWSYLHLPPWLAAFALSFLVAAFGRDLPFLRAMGLGVGDAPDDGEPVAPAPTAAPVPTPAAAPAAEVWTSDSRPAWPVPPAAPPTDFRPFAG